MDLTAIVTTYRNPRALAWCLLALAADVRRAAARVELIVADDGDRGHESRQLARHAAASGAFTRVQRVWQPHAGYGKCRLANRAALRARSALLFYLDGDCLVSPGTISTHLRHARPDRYVAGSPIRLGRFASAQMTTERVLAGRHASATWLLRQKLLGEVQTKSADGWLRPIRYLVDTRTGAGFNGGCSSVWRDRLLEVNGWDETFGYGLDDTDLGMRLKNSGVQPLGAPLSALVVHLWHDRAHPDPQTFARQRGRVETLRRGTETRAERGFAEMAPCDPALWESF